MQAKCFFLLGQMLLALQFKHAIVSPHFQDTHSMNGYRDPGICERGGITMHINRFSSFHIHPPHTNLYACILHCSDLEVGVVGGLGSQGFTPFFHEIQTFKIEIVKLPEVGNGTPPPMENKVLPRIPPLHCKKIGNRVYCL